MTNQSEKKKRKFNIVPMTVIIAIICIVIAAVIVVYLLTVGKLNWVSFDYSDDELGISANPLTVEEIIDINLTDSDDDSIQSDDTAGSDLQAGPELSDFVNIVIFGLSGDSIYDTDRSDTIIICTIDKYNNQLKFTSILRDTKAEIDGYSAQKINAAYRYGGALLAIKTLNKNFNLSLRDYVTFDFDQVESIVDYVGGVDIELSQEEAASLSRDGYYVSAGVNHLDGKTAVKYSRTRSIDSDVYRSERQRKVIGEIFKKVQKMSLTEKIAFITNYIEAVETSLSLTDVIELAGLPLDEYEVFNNVVPDTDKDKDIWGGIDANGEWVWTYDLQYAGKRINNIIYTKQSTKSSEEASVENISQTEEVSQAEDITQTENISQTD